MTQHRGACLLPDLNAEQQSIAAGKARTLKTGLNYYEMPEAGAPRQKAGALGICLVGLCLGPALVRLTIHIHNMHMTIQ